MRLSEHMFDGMGKEALTQFRRTLLEHGKLTLELNDAIDSAMDRAPRPVTPAQVRRWSEWRAVMPVSTSEEMRGMDDAYSEMIHSNWLWLFDEHPGIVADAIIESGTLAYDTIDSALYVYDGNGQERTMYEVWKEPRMHGVECDGLENVAVYARKVTPGNTKQRMRGDYGREFLWCDGELFVFYDDEPNHILWERAECDRCGRPYEPIIG